MQGRSIWVWALYALFLAVLAFLTFGDHGYDITQFLLSIGLKHEINGPPITLPCHIGMLHCPYGQTYTTIPTFIAPNPSAMLLYALAGAIGAFLLSRGTSRPL